MNIEEIRTNNLKILVKKLGRKKFIAQINKSDSQVCQWLNRTPSTRTKKPTSISSPSCRYIEQKLGLREGWMDTYHGEHNPFNDEKIRQVSTPLYEWPDWQDVDSIDRSEPLNWIACPCAEYGPRTYALTMRDDSMKSTTGEWSFNKGDIVFIDPDEPYVEQDFVMATSVEHELASIKQYLFQDGRPCLHTSNPTWQKRYILLDDSIKIHGVVIAKIEVRR